MSHTKDNHIRSIDQTIGQDSTKGTKVHGVTELMTRILNDEISAVCIRNKEDFKSSKSYNSAEIF